MTVSKDLLLSILSMDAYNRGYNPGISGLNDTSNGSVKVGNATVSFNLQDAGTVFSAAAQAAGFYAVAYKLDQAVDTIASGTTITSYRGTDDLPQELGPVDFGISYFQSFQQQQVLMAAQFYDSVKSRSHPQT